MSEFKTVWFWDSETELIDGFNHVMSFYDDRHSKPSVVAGIKQPEHTHYHSFNYLDSESNLAVALVSSDFVNAAPLWYVMAPRDTGYPPMRTVLAFCNDQFPNGTILAYEKAVSLGVDPKDSCGFIKWFCWDNAVQQIYVSEEHRRKRISTKLFAIADILIVSDKDWNGKFLNGGHVTTNDGEKLRSKWVASGSTRIVDRIGSVE